MRISISKLFICFLASLIICIATGDNICPPYPEFGLSEDCNYDGISKSLAKFSLFVPFTPRTVTITPPLSPTSYYDESWKYSLAPGVNYTVVTSVPGRNDCDTVEYFYATKHRFDIQQPKCRSSVGTVSFVRDPLDTKFQSADCNVSPCHYLMETSSESLEFKTQTSECSFSISMYETGDDYPKLKVTDSLCYKNTGSIEILNKESYSKWSLFVYDEPVTETASGYWTNLMTGKYGNPINYYLSLESSKCGVQEIQIPIKTTWPSFNLEFSNNQTCPRNSSLKVHFDDPNIYSDGVKISIENYQVHNGESVYLPNPFQPSFSLLMYYNQTCSSGFYMPSPSLLGDIQYSIDMCAQTPEVTLHYDNPSYTDISITQYNNNGAITMTGPKSFYLQPNEFAKVESCFFSPIIIRAEEQKRPSYTITRPQKYCGDTMDVYVANYYDFEELTMGDAIQHDGNGHFKNIQSNMANINAKLPGCSNHLTEISLDTFYVNSNDFEQIVEIIELPTFNSKGNVSYTVLDKNSNQFSHTSYFSFQNNEEIYLITQLSTCDSIMSSYWIAPDLYQRKLSKDPIIQVVKNTQCVYSRDGIISINSPSNPVTSIVVNSVSISPNSNANPYVFNGLPSGEITLLLNTQVYNVYTTIFIPANNYWEFPAVVTPVTGDCSVSNGKITYDPSIFSDIPDLDEYVDLSSGYHEIQFTLQNDSCSGYANIYVPTNTQSSVKYSVVVNPTCEASEDGAVKVSIVDANNKEWNPTSITSNIASTSYPYFVDMDLGSTTLTVYNDSCSWQLNVELKKQGDPQFSITTLANVLADGDQISFVDISSPSISINSISYLEDFEISKIGGHYWYYPDYNAMGKVHKIWIVYNQWCLTTVDLETTLINLGDKISWPTTSIVPNDCSDPSVQHSKVNVVNPNNMMIYTSGYSQENIYLHSFNPIANFRAYALDRASGFTHDLSFAFSNALSSSTFKNVETSTCPGSFDGSIEIGFDPNVDKTMVMALANPYYSGYVPIPIGEESNLFTKLDNGTFLILKSHNTNPFCQLIDQFDIYPVEPTVSLSSVGLCDASNTAIGDTGVVTNTLSVTTTNVTYNLNGVVSTDPVFKGLSVGDYSSTVTIYNSVCRRVIESNTVSVAKIPSVSVSVDVSACMKAVVIPSVTNVQHQYTIKDSTDKVIHTSTSMGSFTFTATKVDQYTIFVSDNTCSFKSSFTISECPTQPPTQPPTETPTNAPTTGSSSTEMPSSSFKLLPSTLSLMISSIFFIYFLL
ncbi:hypothetical protein CYY_004772 [Polysphondylium violaceum]|uniref:Uncharacterized protein n=1 Tax=Polysphondylium violaceum TaxID=133409 RepID=A0A8J4V045_9MYCE|nr:hypothetical protein CYY_004772 [Polysphondylium violaceum]